MPCERWNPTQSIRTILLSVISLLNEPNTSSPANVDASVSYRKWKDSNETEGEYATIIKQQVEESKIEAAKDNVVVPETTEEFQKYSAKQIEDNKAADEKTKEEMLEQLKKLGDMCLRPFGLSTNSFEMVPQPGGGYSISMKK